jgi:PAS domain S-box-containing protein
MAAGTGAMSSISSKFALLQLVCASLVAVILYASMDRQLLPQLTQSFVTRSEVVTEGLAAAVESSLVAGDITSAQAAIDRMLSVPDVKWAYITAPNGEVLADTFVPQFPDELKRSLSAVNDYAWIRLTGERVPTLVVRRKVLSGGVGTVWVGFNQVNLLSSIRGMERTIRSRIIVVMLIVTFLFVAVTRRIIAPVRSLTQAAQLLPGNAGEAFRPLPVQSGDELGVLTRTFNSMASEVREQRETLEARVHERTEMLSLTNAGLATEMAERERAQEALRESSELVMLLLESAPEAIYGIDLEGNCTFCNTACLRLTGYQENSELLGRNMHNVIHYAHPGGAPYPVEECDIYQAFSKGLHTHGDDEVFWRKDGTSFPAEYWSRLLHRNHRVIGMVVTFVDVTVRKQAEEAMRNAKEAAEAGSRAKSEFLANMSHEIRTPLNGVIGMTELALGTDLTQEQREYLQTVKLSSDALLNVINDVLDFSKIEAGKTELEASDFNLRDHLETLLRTFALRASEKQLELLCVVDPEVPDRVRGDPFRLRRILVNLLGNAIKFTDAGEVALRVQGDQVDAQGSLLHFSVSDTGVGIAPDVLKMIFEPFTQADSSTTRIHGGTGLGLAISARLVKMMDGEIWVESEPGRGSAFHFTARLHAAEAGPAVSSRAMGGRTDVAALIARSPEGTGEAAESLRVLLAEDNAVNRKVATKLLEKRGHQVVVTSNGKEALAALQEDTYDLVLMDVQMPEMDGLEATRAIRGLEQGTGFHQQIIALTAHAMIGDRERCLEAGMDGYLTKPLRPQELDQLLASYAQREARSTQS